MILTKTKHIGAKSLLHTNVWYSQATTEENMVLRVVRFSSGGTKLERVLPKNQYTLRKLLNFENWTNGEPQ